MSPKEAFTFLDQCLSTAKITLTPPEWMRFIQAMQTLALVVQPTADEASPTPQHLT